MEKHFGRYRISGQIGRGGMAAVYRAHDSAFERDVAIKVLPHELMRDAAFQERFQLEARAIAALEHGAIVPVYDFGQEDGQPYLVMRYMAGGSLADWIARGPVPLNTLLEVVDRTAAALDAAHDHRMVHRDLKPANILFDQYNSAFLSDFGIARLLEASTTLTGSSVIGTPAYMAPEMFDGAQPSPAMDIYALGVTIYEMLTGKRPFDATTPVALMMAHVQQPVPDIRAARPDLPEAVQRVIEKALAKDPAQRYARAGLLAAELRRAFASVSTPQPEIPYGTTPFTSPLPAIDTPPPVPPQPPIKAERPRRGPLTACLVIGGALLAVITLGGAALIGFGGVLSLATLQSVQQQGAQPASTNTPATEENYQAPPPIATQTPLPTLMAGYFSPLLPAEIIGGRPSAGQPGGRLAYTRGEGDSADIYMLRTNLSSNTQLTLGRTFDGEADWSPDGVYIAYESIGQQRSDTGILIMEAATGQARTLIDTATEEGHPDWSPDGAQIVYEAGPRGATDIYIIDVDGGTPRQLTTGGRSRTPKFSPDGAQIVYVMQVDGRWRVAVRPAAGGAEQLYDCPGLDCRFPDWSPDGRQVVFNTLDEFGGPDEIWALDLASEQAGLLVTGQANGRPAWAENQYIYFNRTTDQYSDIYRLDLDSGDIELVIEADGANLYGPDWTP